MDRILKVYSWSSLAMGSVALGVIGWTLYAIYPYFSEKDNLFGFIMICAIFSCLLSAGAWPFYKVVKLLLEDRKKTRKDQLEVT